MRGKPILALVFVAMLAVVLTIPLRGTSDGGSQKSKRARSEDKPTPHETKTPEEKVTPSAEPTEEPTEEPVDNARLTGKYPKSCLEAAPAPEDSGLLAIDQGAGIEIGDIAGGDPVTVDDESPFRWSPSGQYLMAGSGTVYDASGNEVASLFEDGGSFSWGWSPISDCLVYASEEGGVSVFVPGSRPKRSLHEGLFSGFSFSPSGGDLAFVEDDPENQEAHIWVTSLSTGKGRRLTTLEPSLDEEVVLAGWTPDATQVLFWNGSSEALLETGGSLFAVSAGGNVQSLASVLAYRDFVTPCGDDLLAVVGGGARNKSNSKRLARLQVGSPPEYLTPPDAHDVSPSCSPDGDLVAVARSAGASGKRPGRLAILGLDGTVQFSSAASGFGDAYPLWGPGSAGVLFVRQPSSGEDDPELWRISQTSPAQSTGIALRSVGREPGLLRDSWGQWIDWSADLPSGVSVMSPAES